MPDDQASIEPVPPAAAPAAAKKRKKLTKMQEAVAREVVRDPNASLSQIGEAANIGGKTKTGIASNAWRTLQKAHVKDRIRELMNKRKDTSLDGLHRTLSEGLKAEEIKFFAHEGRVKDKRVTVDHVTRHRYLETALELHGALEKEKDGGSTTNNFFTKEAIETFVAAFKGRPQA